MAGSTISNHVTIGVTLGSGLYPSPLTIMSSGYIDPGAGGFFSAPGLVATIASGYVLNQGTIAGAASPVVNGGAYLGGAGVFLDGGDSLTNQGSIVGGASGSRSGDSFYPGAGGGVGVDISGASLTNFGTIDGGGFTPFSIATNGANGGGDGVSVTNGRLTNYGAIVGARYGGAGVTATSSTVINMSGITGGDLTGVGVQLTSSTLVNAGMIVGGNGDQGVFESIPGGNGVNASGSTVTNDGTIIGGPGGAARGGYGVHLDDNSLLINNGKISAGNAVFNDGGVVAVSGKIINNGTITGQSDGVGDYRATAVYLNPQVSLTNTSSGVIDSAFGVSADAGSTVVNAGTIMSLYHNGLSGYAVRFGFGGGADLLIDEPGAVFVGSVVAEGTAATLELASAASAGTITDIGSSFSGFGTITVDAGATWVAFGSVTSAGTIGIGAGSDMVFQNGVAATAPVDFVTNTGSLGIGDASGFAATVFGFQVGDAIDFTSISSAGSITAGVDGSNDLTLTSGGSLLAEIKLDPVQNFARDVFHALPDGGSGTLVTVTPLCFLAGTMIETPDGEIEVERLAVGDRVVTASGAVRPIVWIGTGRVLATRGRRSAATPVIVRKGALADNVPYCDLAVTKAHALFVDDVLIPVEFLVNHRSILWDDMAQEVTLYHVELETHDVLVANGAPAESYRDDGNRWLFHNNNSSWSLPTRAPCAPVLTGGAVVDAAWRRLLARAGGRPGVPLTDDPDLHMVVDGCRVDAVSQTGGFYVFRLAERAARVRLVSRASVPQELGLVRDPRCLGVAVGRIVVRQGARFRLVEAGDARLADGFHAFEGAEGFRWTDGDAGLPTVLFAGSAGAMEVVVQCVATGRYVADEERRRVA